MEWSGNSAVEHSFNLSAGKLIREKEQRGKDRRTNTDVILATTLRSLGVSGFYSCLFSVVEHHISSDYHVFRGSSKGFYS